MKRERPRFTMTLIVEQDGSCVSFRETAETVEELHYTMKGLLAAAARAEAERETERCNVK